MNISAEEKNRYLREAEVVLAREGFLTDRIRTGGLRVLLDGLPLCEVPESGGVTYRMADIGVYIGGGQVIEAMGTRYGVVKTQLQGRGWTHWLEIPYINYD